MKTKWALWAGAAIGAGALLPSAAHAQAAAAGGPFADVPQGHWAYDAVQQLAQRGIFTGYPDGTFAGKRALTRYEFAVALQRMLQEVQRQVAAIALKPGPQGNPGVPGAQGAQGTQGERGLQGEKGDTGVKPEELEELRRQQGLLRQDIDKLQRLTQEFASELAMLGSDLEQQKRNLQALSDRVTRLENKVSRIPIITGVFNTGARATGVTGPGLGSAGGPGGANPVPGLVDRDGRLLNASNSLLKGTEEFYDVDLGITANISDVATAHLLLNAGNYLTGYLGNRVSMVNPYSGQGSTSAGAGGLPNGPAFNVEGVTPYYLYIETPLKLAGTTTQLTVGKFGEQFTPYTLKMVDVDSYFYNDKTDLGDYPVSGGRANFKALGLNWSLYAGKNDTEYAQLTSTAGFVMPGLYDGNLGNNRFAPQGRTLDFLAGGTLLDQSAGLRATYVTKRLSLGATYLAAAGSSSDGDPLTFEQFRQLSVYGVDWRIGLFRNIAFTGAVTESKWNSQGGGDVQFSTYGISENDRRAWDLRLEVPIKKALLTGYYKRIGDGFDAPGDWGRMGNWINPRGIEGFGGTFTMPLGHRLALDFEGAEYNYRGYRDNAGLGDPGSPSSNLLYLRGGLKYPLSAKNSVGVGYELADYTPNGPGALKREEQYYNIGFTHQFSPSLTFRLLYQFMDIHSGPDLELPGFNYNANIIATQFQARF